MYQMQFKTQDDHTYIIAEAGQNHNGDVCKAKWLIDIAALQIGHGSQDNIFSADAIKFCKRELSEELTFAAGKAKYSGPHSYGKTYMEHRNALELTYEEHAILFDYAKKRGLDFIETVCSPGALRLRKYFRPDFWKIASRDIDNIQLLKAVREMDSPIIISTGMSGWEEVKTAYDILAAKNQDIIILHCISQYPADYENLNLKSIHFLKNSFAAHVVGYSDHTTGVLAPALAVAMGAKVIEKHITYNRMAKGSDHSGSMDHEGFARVVRDIRNVELAIGNYEKWKHPAVIPAEQKLRRVLCARVDIHAGEKIGNRIIFLSGEGDFHGVDYENMKEKVAKKDIMRYTGIMEGDVK